MCPLREIGPREESACTVCETGWGGYPSETSAQICSRNDESHQTNLYRYLHIARIHRLRARTWVYRAYFHRMCAKLRCIRSRFWQNGGSLNNGCLPSQQSVMQVWCVGTAYGIWRSAAFNKPNTYFANGKRTGKSCSTQCRREKVVKVFSGTSTSLVATRRRTMKAVNVGYTHFALKKFAKHCTLSWTREGERPRIDRAEGMLRDQRELSAF